MLTTSQSVVSATDHTAMTTTTVPCRIRMLPKIHRIPRNKSKGGSKNNTKNVWKNPKKTKKITTTPVKKAAPPTIRMSSTPSTMASSPGASVAKTASPSASVDTKKQEEESRSPTEEEEVKPRKQCDITFLPNVHKRVRPAAPICDDEEDDLIPLQEISFVHSDQGEESSEIARTLQFGEDEGFEDMVLLNESAIEEDQEEDGHFLNRNSIDGLDNFDSKVDTPQPYVNSSMETEPRHNREDKLLNTSFPQQQQQQQENEVTFDSDPINNTRVSNNNDLSFETPISMAENERMHPLNESPIIRPRHQVVGEETIMDTSGEEVEMVRNSFFDNEEMVAALNKEKVPEIPKEIIAISVSTAVVDDRDFVSPMQRLRSQRSNSNLEWDAEQETRAGTDRRDVALTKQKRKETKRKSNIAKHMAAERKKQEAAIIVKAKQQEEEAMLQAMIAQAKKQEEAEKRARLAVKARQSKHLENQKKRQAVKEQKKAKEQVKSQKNKPVVKQQQKEKKPVVSSPVSIEKPAIQQPSSPTGSSFVPEWATKSLRKTRTSLSSPSETVKPTVSSSSITTSATSSMNKKKTKVVPAWANKQLRKSSTSSRSSSVQSSSDDEPASSIVSDELSSWMGKRRRASEEGIQKASTAGL